MPRATATRPRPSTIAQDGLVVRRYGKSGRAYYWNGIKFVSVSETKDVLRKRLENWSAKCERELVLGKVEEYLTGRDLSQLSPSGIRAAVLASCGEQYAWVKARSDAGSIGHEVHSAIEIWLAWKVFEQVGGVQPPDVPILQGPALVSFEKFLAWAKATDLQPIASELSVCSPTDKWGGTLDELAYVEGEPAILDWKSGGNLYLEDYMQISAYRRGYNEFEPARVKGIDRVDRCYLVHLPKKADDAPTRIVQLDQAELDHHYATFQLAVPLAYRMNAWEAQRKGVAA